MSVGGGVKATRVALAAAAVVALAATACAPPPPPPPPPPSACQSVGAASTSPSPSSSAWPGGRRLSPDEAERAARAASFASPVRTKTGAIPLVTVEERAGRPVVTTTPVRSADEAAAVARQIATGAELVAVDVDKPVAALADPNDPLFAQQWAFNEVPYVAAWTTDATTGAGITVAVIDTGVMANHADLGASPNGPVLSGEYFLHSNDGQTAFQGSGGTTDPNGHGTHVSGIVAAASNNGVGVSGAAPAVKVLPVQVLCADGTGWNSDVANGITWAVDNGAKVINLSLGGGADSALQAAISYANSKGVVVAAAAGNTGQKGNTPVYPAAYSTQLANVIAVAATTNATPPAHAFYSTSGSYINLAAPGGNACGCGSSGEVLSTWNDGGYRSISGTSMATPYVSAAAALLRAANSTCTPDKVRTRLMSTANTNLNAGSGSFQQQFGAGLVDPNTAATSCP